VIATGALVGVAGAAGSSVASCAQTPVAIPIQTFDRPQNIDVVCMHVNDGAGNNIIPPVPEPQALCPPVPVNLIGNDLPYHLFALVTQTVRGQVAVVDLTGGFVVDSDLSTPGINLLTVGTLPSDIASAPDGKMSYVGSANPNAPAIYALPSTVLLGDSLGSTTPSGAVVPIPGLTSWPVCALPQAPGAISIVPTSVLGAAERRRAPAREVTALDDAGEDSGRPTRVTAVTLASSRNPPREMPATRATRASSPATREATQARRTRAATRASPHRARRGPATCSPWFSPATRRIRRASDSSTRPRSSAVPGRRCPTRASLRTRRRRTRRARSSRARSSRT
jgi:hypothetical protein